MKNVLLALTVLVIVITGTRCEDAQAYPNQPESTSPEAEKLGKAVLAAISTDNYAAFCDLFVTQHEYYVVLNSSDNPNMHMRADDSIAGMQEIHRNAKRSFDNVQRGGVRDGIVWEKAQFKSAFFKTDTVDNVELIRLKVVFTFRAVEYEFCATEVVKTDKGWKLWGELAYGDHLYDRRRPLSEAEQLEIVDALIDSIVKADSMAAIYAYRAADSARIADSIAASQAKKKGKKKK